MLGLGAQCVEHAGDFRQQRQTMRFGKHSQEARVGLAAGLRRQQGDGVIATQLRVGEQGRHARVGGDVGGERQSVRPRRERAFVTRGREGGAGVRAGKREGLAHP
ncbi:hypothetical protein D3C73_1300690 [compost metagenome]